MAMQKVQSLVGAAGDWMAGDPLTSAIGVKINAATDEGLLMEDWTLNMEICDMVNMIEDGPTQAVRAIKRRLQNSVGKSHKSSLFTLIVLETCVCQKDFSNELINRVTAANLEVSTEIQDKVLSLIQSWAHAFSPDPELQGVAEVVQDDLVSFGNCIVQVYMDLKRKGIEFPTPSDDDLLLVQSCQAAVDTQRLPSSASSSSCSSSGSKAKGIKSPAASGTNQGRTPQRRTSSRQSQVARLPPSGLLTEGQLSKLERDLEIAQRNTEVFSELLTELTPGQEHPEDRRLLLDVGATCREMQARVLELIGLVQHRELTAALLDINDQMNNHLLRFERYKNNMERDSSSSLMSPSDEPFSPDEVLNLTLPAVPTPVPSSTTQLKNTAADEPILAKTGGSETDFHEIEAWIAEEGGEAALVAMIGGDPSAEEESDTTPRDGASGRSEATTAEFDRFLQKRVEAVEMKKA